MRRNQLLKNTLSGNELAVLENACPALKKAHHAAIAPGETGNWAQIVELTRAYCSKTRDGIYGGPIMAGDAIFLASFMARVRPAYMVEIGVASGFSSGFILTVAKALGLLRDGPFLYSYDLEEKLPNNTVGQYVDQHCSDLKRYWALHTKSTMLDILKSAAPFPKGDGPVLAFVDGGHRHPWPMVDVDGLGKLLPRPFWTVLQDYQMTEQWYGLTIEFGTPMNRPVRGVNLAVALWPGRKQIGTKLCYNSAALLLDDDADRMAEYKQRIRDYPYEIDFPAEAERVIFE